MAQPSTEEIGSIRLDGKGYRVVRVNGKQTSFGQDFADEAPWGQGLPPSLSDPLSTWHLGGLKSRPGIPGTSEYGVNTDGRFAFRLLPAALITDLTLTSSTEVPQSIFEAMGYLFVVAGSRVYRINLSNDAVVMSHHFTGGAIGVQGLRWEDDYALVTTDAATQSLWKLSLANIGVADGSNADTWTQTADVVAFRLTAGINRLFKVDKTGNLRNLSTGVDPMTEANWADNVQCGEKTAPSGIASYERTVFVGKPEGMFGVGDDGFGVSLIRRMSRNQDNCFNMMTWDPYVLIPHLRGLYRYSPLNVEDVGLEVEKLNESPVRGHWKAFAADGNWIYGMLYTGSETYVMVGHERRGQEAGLGPIIWDTWLNFSATSYAAWMSTSTTSPRLWFGKGNNVSYVTLSAGGGAPDVDGSDYRFAAAGSRYFSRQRAFAPSSNGYFTPQRFEDWHNKDFHKIVAVGKNLSPTHRTWTLYWSIDGTSFSNLDVNGAAMTMTSDGLHTFFLPHNIVGREIQIRADYTNNEPAEAAELSYIEVFAVPQSLKMPLFSLTLELEYHTRHDQEIEERTAATQLNDLIALTETAFSCVASGPFWAGDVQVWARHVKLVETLQEGRNEPVFLVQLTLQEREEA